jgi:hypothetical protein
VSVFSEGEGTGATFTINLPFVGVVSNHKEAESTPSANTEELMISRAYLHSRASKCWWSMMRLTRAS